MVQKNKKWTAFFLVLGLVCAVVGCSNGDNEPKGEKAYNFSLKDLNGNTYRLSDFKGKVVILDFWDTWCPPCRREIPHFIELYHKYQNNGFVMIGAAGARYGEEAVSKFLSEYKVPYLNVMANAETIHGYGNFRSIPTTFVIDKQGYIYKKYVGYNPKEIFEMDIKTLLDL
jgi:thiol-disulfide isomerase/thioredoxin